MIFWCRNNFIQKAGGASGRSKVNEQSYFGNSDNQGKADTVTAACTAVSLLYLGYTTSSCIRDSATLQNILSSSTKCPQEKCSIALKKILCYILPDMDLHKGCSYVKKKKQRPKKKDPGRIISTELSTDDYSQASSHYRLARDLLPAAFRPWAGSVLIMQPGRSCGLLRSAHIDARLSAGARST